MATLDATSPADSDLISLGAANIRAFKTAVQTIVRSTGVTGSRPTAGGYGLYFDTTRNALQMDTGAAWIDIGTMLPATTGCVFYQAAAPVGWTKSTANNDKALRVVSGNGGGTGGVSAVSSGQTVAAHAHYLEDDASLGTIETANVYYAGRVTLSPDYTEESLGVAVQASGVNRVAVKKYYTKTDGASTASVLQYVDVIVCAKD